MKTDRSFRMGALTTLVLVMSVGLDAWADNSVEVESDRLEIDHKARSARFEGNVLARYGDITLRCDRMTATYSDTNAVTSLLASGHVSVLQGNTSATSGSARLDARLGLLVLEGKPVVIRGANRLEGKRISIHLQSGRLEVTRAKGVFTLGVGNPR
jgi:lipopolysaccharide export system protein LptA